jgi:hypothetical protein
LLGYRGLPSLARLAWIAVAHRIGGPYICRHAVFEEEQGQGDRMTEEDMEKMAPTDNPILAEFGNLLMKSMRAEMAWEFSADDTVAASATLLGNSVTRTGSWRYISGDENSTTIKVEFENEEPRELSFTFSDPNTIEATPFSSGKWKWNRIVKFKRVVPTPQGSPSP